MSQGLGELGDGLIRIAVLDPVADAVAQVAFENDLPDFVQGPLYARPLAAEAFVAEYIQPQRA